MRSKASKEKRNDTMTLSDRKYFATMIRSGAKYKEVRQEHLRIFKKTIRHVFNLIAVHSIAVHSQFSKINTPAGL